MPVFPGLCEGEQPAPTKTVINIHDEEVTLPNPIFVWVFQYFQRIKTAAVGHQDEFWIYRAGKVQAVPHFHSSLHFHVLICICVSTCFKMSYPRILANQNRAQQLLHHTAQKVQLQWMCSVLQNGKWSKQCPKKQYLSRTLFFKITLH